MSTVMPSWRSCSWSTDVTRSRMWFVWVRIENRAGLAGGILEHAVAVPVGQPRRRQQLARAARDR